MDEYMRAWWRTASLSLNGKPGDPRAVELATGPLAELILLARSLPEQDRVNAYIELEDSSDLDGLTWPQIEELSNHPDFPVII